jgi:hypothetical protein
MSRAIDIMVMASSLCFYCCWKYLSKNKSHHLEYLHLILGDDYPIYHKMFQMFQLVSLKRVLSFPLHLAFLLLSIDLISVQKLPYIILFAFPFLLKCPLIKIKVTTILASLMAFLIKVTQFIVLQISFH